MKTFSIFILLAVMLLKGESQSCSHKTIDPLSGAEIVFSQLNLIKPLDENLDFVVQDATNPDFAYSFRICENTVSQCGGEGPTPVCQSTRGGSYYSLGQLGTQFFLDYPSLDKSRGLMVEYSNGTICGGTGRPRRVILTLECDPTSIGPISAITAANHQNQDPCEYEIYARSQYACPDVADNVCAGQAGCAGCTLLQGCGWCGPTQKCIRGNEERPLDGSFCFGSKSYNYGSPLDCVDCTSINSCSECNADPNCKWCSDGNCVADLERECEEIICKCPACKKGEYCPPEGGKCKKLGNSAGLFVGGMFLGFAIVGIAWGGYVFYSKKSSSSEYSGLA